MNTWGFHDVWILSYIGTKCLLLPFLLNLVPKVLVTATGKKREDRWIGEEIIETVIIHR